MIERRKLKHSKINSGVEFVIPIPTVQSYEKYLEKLSKLEDKESTDQSLVNKIMLVSLIQELDETVSLDTINSLHPMDFQLLMDECSKVYMDGGEIDTKENKKKE